MNGITCDIEISDIIAAEVDAETGTTAASDALAAIRADGRVCSWAMSTKWESLGRTQLGAWDRDTPWTHEVWQRSVFLEVSDGSEYPWVRVEYRRYGRAGKIRTTAYRGRLFLPDGDATRLPSGKRWNWVTDPAEIDATIGQ